MNKPRVLLVEDDAPIRRFVALALEDEPVELVQAATCAEATRALQGRAFSVVLCDLLLPDGSGLDLLLSLGEPDAPSAGAARVVFSAGVSADQRQQLLQAGVFRVLDKPVTLDALLACTRHALTSRGAVGPGLQPAPGPPCALANEITHAVAHFFGGNHQLYVDYERHCRLQFSADLQLGQQALARADLPALHRLAHSLKSVLQSLGHGPASGLAARLETAAERAQQQECTTLWPQLAGWLRAHATP